MKELQEEYLFLNREGINGWNDVFDTKHKAERRIADIDAKKKELYNEHARYKYQYEKDGDVTVYLYHEAHYREQLAELKEKRKEIKSELGTINRCLKESTYAHLEIPDDVDIENLYMVDVPEFEGSKVSYTEYDAYEELAVETISTEATIYEPYEYESVTSMDAVDKVCDEARQMVTDAEAAILEAEELLSDYEKSDNMQEVVTEIEAEVPAQPEPVEVYYEVSQPVMTKELYLSLTDKEKVEWLGLADCSVQEAIHRFVNKLDSIGIVYKYSDDMLDEFMRLEAVVAERKRERHLEKGERSR